MERWFLDSICKNFALDYKDMKPFFANQIEAITEGVTIPKRGLIYGKYLFEIGRERKSFEQIEDIDNSYLAVDDIEIGIGNRKDTII